METQTERIRRAQQAMLTLIGAGNETVTVKATPRRVVVRRHRKEDFAIAAACVGTAYTSAYFVRALLTGGEPDMPLVLKLFMVVGPALLSVGFAWVFLYDTRVELDVLRGTLRFMTYRFQREPLLTLSSSEVARVVVRAARPGDEMPQEETPPEPAEPDPAEDEPYEYTIQIETTSGERISFCRVRTKAELDIIRERFLVPLGRPVAEESARDQTSA
jgi:hypothetical protein